MSSETGPNVNLRIDKSGPRVSVTNVTAGSQYVTTAVPVAACSTNDSLSGVVSQEALSPFIRRGEASAT